MTAQLTRVGSTLCVFPFAWYTWCFAGVKREDVLNQVVKKGGMTVVRSFQLEGLDWPILLSLLKHFTFMSCSLNFKFLKVKNDISFSFAIFYYTSTSSFAYSKFFKK